jgi:hypothetical protein
LNIGGNANLEAEKTLTVQGSTLNVTGDTAISATDVQVLAGKDVDRVTTRTVTTSFLQIENLGGGESSSSGSQSGTESDSSKEASASASAADGEASASASASGSASAGASAGAQAAYANSAGVTLAKTQITTEKTVSQRSVGSALNLGGNVTINARETVTLQGSELNAAGNLDLNAKNVQLLAAQNIETREFSDVTARLGLYASTENEASASAEASANASGKAGTSASASKSGQSANVEASVEGELQAWPDSTASKKPMLISRESSQPCSERGSMTRQTLPPCSRNSRYIVFIGPHETKWLDGGVDSRFPQTNSSGKSRAMGPNLLRNSGSPNCLWHPPRNEAANTRSG